MANRVFAQGSVFWTSIPGIFMNAQTNTTRDFFGIPIGGGTSGRIQGAASLGTGFYFELLIGSA
jgi:hypothetical protein